MSRVRSETLGPRDLAAIVTSFDPVARKSFDRLLRLIARVVDMPMAAITVVEDGKHTAPYAVGMENPDQKVYICSYAIRCDDLEIIPDTLSDARVAEMTVVTGYPHIRFYAGMPLISPRGDRLGTLAVMDTMPRTLSQRQKDDIKIFADQVMFQLEVRNQTKELYLLSGKLQEAYRMARIGNWEWERDSDHLTWSYELYRMLGRSPANPIGNAANFLREVHAEDRERVEAVRDGALQSQLAYELNYRVMQSNGQAVFIHERGEAVRDGEGNVRGLFGCAQDITAQKRAEADLHAQQRLTSEIIDALPVNIYVKDADGRYLMFNEDSANTTNVSKDGAVGKTDFDLFPRHIAAAIRDKDRQVLAGRGLALEESTIVVHGQERVMLAGRKAIHINEDSPKLLGFAIDIHDRKQSELRAQYLATHDPLTGLPNRSLLTDRLDQAIARTHRSGCLIAVMYLDLDRFKMVNDSFGHKSGDQLLHVMAGRLRQAVRDGDTVARPGGDEFVILLEDLAQEDDAAHIAEQVLAQLSRPVTLDSHELVVAASIGITVYPKHGTNDSRTTTALLREADIAMYQAKEHGGGTLCYFDPTMNERVVESLLMENALRRSLDREELALHYQPIVDLTTGNLAGMEALVRWVHPEKGLLGPGQFMWLAEEAGLIVALGEWVLRAACRQQRTWRRMGLQVPRMAVNLSYKQFGPHNLARMVQSVLEENELDACLLKLEITETGLMQDVARANDTLAELSSMGVEVAIDDFGTGYSSLSYLKSLPIDTLKVDRSFVRGVGIDADDDAIVTATIGLAHHLGLRVIAEGIETPEQLACLTHQRCDEGQGYYFSPPVPADAMEALLRAEEPFASLTSKANGQVNGFSNE